MEKNESGDNKQEQSNCVGVQTEPSPQHDDELWFANGNLVLIARDVEFRIWKALLIRHSPVFRDMLSLPQDTPVTGTSSDGGSATPTVTSGTRTAPAVVHLSDSPEDLRHFLRAFFPGKTLRPMGRLDPPYAELTAQIRLGHKYEVDVMVQRNLEYLKQYYVDEYYTWLNAPTPELPPRGFEEKHAIGVVNLARLTGADTILSTALLHCSVLSAELLTEGYEREDGSREVLSMEDIGRCLCGKQEHVKGSILSMHKVFTHGTNADCSRKETCEAVMRKLQDRVMSSEVEDILREYDWWSTLKHFIGRVDKERELCWACYNSMVGQWHTVVAKTLFDKLPMQLGLSTGNENGE